WPPTERRCARASPPFGPGRPAARRSAVVGMSSSRTAVPHLPPAAQSAARAALAVLGEAVGGEPFPWLEAAPWSGSLGSAAHRHLPGSGSGREPATQPARRRWPRRSPSGGDQLRVPPRRTKFRSLISPRWVGGSGWTTSESIALTDTRRPACTLRRLASIMGRCRRASTYAPAIAPNRRLRTSLAAIRASPARNLGRYFQHSGSG